MNWVSSSAVLEHMAAGGHRLAGRHYHLLRQREDARLHCHFTPLEPLRGGQLVVAEWLHGWPLTSPIYGDGWQMLQQWRGTLGQPQAVGRCGDAATFRLYEPAGLPRIYNLLLVDLGAAGVIGLALTSAEPVNGYFEIEGPWLRLVFDLNGIEFTPGIGIALPSLLVVAGESSAAVCDAIAAALPAPPFLPKAIGGWCSWYHYYAGVTAADIDENLQQMAHDWPGLDYLLLDDGYQAEMGDWLEPSDRFDGGIGPLVARIHAAGKQPALWLAPLIASGQSHLLRDHPDWFVQGDDGRPLAAETVTYGGWRQTPWYMLDGSHPAVCDHLRRLFARLRDEHDIRLFKLDALLWGALPFGRRHRPRLGAVGAYRAALQAIREGAGDALLIGCNAPMWPSLGLVDLMRIGDDVERSHERLVALAHELAGRRWGHRRLWLADPDCLTLQDGAGQHADAGDYRLHAALAFAYAGVAISGDRLASLGPQARRWLQQLLALQAEGFDGVMLDPLSCGANGRGQVAWGDGQLLLCWRSQGAEEGNWTLPLPSGDWCWHELLRDLRGQGPCTLEGDMAAKADGAVLLLRPRM